MNKNSIKTAALILALILLGTNLLSMRGLKRELGELRQDYARLEEYMHSSIDDIRYVMQDQYENIDNMLEMDQSIFSQTSVELKPQDGKIAVTMWAIPKEISESEKLVARVTAGGKIYEQETDEMNQVVILVDMVESLVPTFIIKSETGIRQEAMDEQYTSDMLASRYTSGWDFEDGKMEFGLFITANEGNPLPFTLDEIAKAEFIVSNSGIVEDSNQGYGSNSASTSMAVPAEVWERQKFDQIEGERVAAAALSKTGQFEIGYQADFSEYANRKEGIRYNLYFILTTKGGISYATPYEAGYFSAAAKSQSTSGGDGMLYPIFQ